MIPDAHAFKIGIAWQGNPKNRDDAYRSLPLHHFEMLARVKRVLLLSLQVGPGSEQLAAARFPITNLGNRFDPTSLEDLAAVLMNLDLVVTVDSIVAHVAGALGVPVWVLLRYCADWRWLMDRADCPWYPTMPISPVPLGSVARSVGACQRRIEIENCGMRSA